MILFISDCPLMLQDNLPDLKGPVSCHLSSSCTSIECCLDVVQINRSVAFFLNIDTCNYILSLGIENLVFNKSLIDYNFGKYEQYNLVDLIQMK